jgi:hypothetical protein
VRSCSQKEKKDNKNERRQKSQSEDVVTMEKGYRYVMLLNIEERGGKNHEPRDVRSFCKFEKTRKHLVPLQPPEGTQSYIILFQ